MIPKMLSKNEHVIYLILSNMTNKVYVGKTKSAYHRCYQYIRAYRNNDRKQINNHLFNAFQNYGFANFKMIVWQVCQTDDQLSQAELIWIDYFRATDRNHGFNIRRDSRDGMITHSETKIKISNRLKTEWANGVRQKHAEKLRQSWVRSPTRHLEQSETMRKNLTKYKYLIYINDILCFDCQYAMLKVLGLSSILSAFHRKKSNTAYIKGFRIERIS